MKSAKYIVAAAFCVGVFVVLALVFKHSESRPAIDSQPSTAAGEVLAQQLAQLLNGNGSVVIVGSALAKIAGSESSAQITSFRESMARGNRLRITAVEFLPTSGVGGMNLGLVTADQLSEIINKYPDANALVIFAGLPPLTSALAGELSDRNLKVLAVCGYGTVVRAWLKAKALDAVVIPRMGSPPQADPNTLMGRFDQQFQLVTPKTLEQLPY